MDVLRSVALLTAVMTVWAVPAAPAHAACTGAWEVSDGGTYKVWLRDIAMADQTHGWAVGYRLDASGAERHRLLSWNGTSWSDVTPALPSTTSELLSVWAIAQADVWASGRYQDEVSDESLPLAFHWDGVSWEQVSLPSADTPRAAALWASGPDDVWIAGTEYVGNRYGGMVMHFDGSEWTKIPVPNPPDQDRWLWGIHGSAHDDIWAVGQSFAMDTYKARPLAIHWDGVAWTRVLIDRARSQGNTTFLDVVTFGSKHAWAVGHRSNTARILMQRWNGTQWKNVQLPTMSGYQALAGVSAISATEVIAVGSRGKDPLILRREGTAWVQHAASMDGELAAVTSIDNIFWTAGSTGRSSLILTRCV